MSIIDNAFQGGTPPMPPSDAQKKATAKWNAEKVDRVIFRVAKGKKEQIQEHAAARGESLSAFLNRAVDETMERDSQK